MPRLTKRTVDALAPRETDYIVFDGDVSGFGVRVLPSGKKSYMIQYRASGRQRRVTIGKHGAITVDQARTQARELFGEIARGEDPAEAIAVYRRAPDISALCDRFIDEYVMVRCKPTTIREYQRAVDLFIKPAFGSRKICDISRSDVAELHHKNRHRPYQANRTLGVISKMFNLAELWGLRPDGSNPTRHVPKYRERGRERYLSKLELAHLFATLDTLEAAGEESPAACNAFRLLATTGCRLTEIQTLKWSYVQPPHIFIPDSKTGPRRIPLTAEVSKILDGIERVPGNPYVIVGAAEGAHLTDLQKPWRRIRKKAGFDDARIHDLRHTYASHAMMAGVSRDELAKLLGHNDLQSTARYSHFSEAHILGAANTASAQIGAQMGLNWPAPAAASGDHTSSVVNLASFRKDR
ncbi:tyrosine-type recombinase/integrase [Thalassobaculum litoreum]|uniref:Site-specific recombinase XerD n=1 Tax=Thalassobaculum litoreum DSM 18839 TaxID=1123362 RepID=A0A8G2BN35_9PROT|nr:site-specific integrase [Thalassobaculum litoreum]SDG57619.1 Site-specific recombinase XerD [Thalassobaculum litoreum DSM 18839]